ncbi:MAG: molybdopterin-dependent oxidoreductase [Pseudomonadota bacterium]
MTDVATHYRKCNLCEAMCGLEIRHRGEEILSIRGDPEDPISHGHICPKAVALQDFHSDPERLKTPLKRSGNDWEPMAWEDAIAEVAERLRAVQARHGANAVGTYLGNPNAHNFGNTFFIPRFFGALGSKTRFSASSADQWPHHFASYTMFGHPMLVPIPDIDRTDWMLIIGGNPMVSNGSMMTAPAFPRRMKALQERGGRVVVVDPRRTETAAKADEHIFIRPESDAALLMAMIHVVAEDNAVRLRHLEPLADGLDALLAAATEFSPEKVASFTGVSAAATRRLAREMIAAPSAVCYSRMGASTQSFGGLCQWLTNALNLLTGNVDREGGAMFTSPAFDLVALNPYNSRPDAFGRYRSTVRGLPSFLGELPVAALAEDILHPGEGGIRAMVTIAGNPVLSCPDGRRIDEALDSLEFMVSIDPYLNETTRHADIILPPTIGLEVSHFDVYFNLFSVRNTASYSRPLFPKTDAQRHDWEILSALTTALATALGDAAGDAPGKAIGGQTPEQMLDAAFKAGPLGARGIDLKSLAAMPQGIDLGPLEPCLSGRLQTAEGTIDLAPERLLADVPRLAAAVEDGEGHDAGFPFDLIGRRLPRSHNTWLHNSHRLVKGKNQCTLLMHPEDAGAAGIADGDWAAVRSPTGRVEIQVAVSDEMMPGVVSMPQGWGHGRQGTRQSVAARSPGVSINDLTDAGRVDALTGNAAFNGMPVAVEALQADTRG